MGEISYHYKCHNCPYDFELPPSVAKTAYYLCCPRCGTRIESGFSPPEYRPNVEGKSREELAERIVHHEAQRHELILHNAQFRDDEGVDIEDVHRQYRRAEEHEECGGRLNSMRAQLAAAGFPLSEDETAEAKRRIEDRHRRHAIGWLARNEDSTMPCPRCRKSIAVGTAYCPMCGFALWRPTDAPLVFLCHASADKEKVRQIASALSKSGLDVFLDEQSIKVGDSIQEKIEEGISAAHYFVIALSPCSVKSGWVREELKAALGRTIDERTHFILPALLESCEIPLFLRDRLYADLRGDNYESGIQALKDAIANSQRDRDYGAA